MMPPMHSAHPPDSATRNALGLRLPEWLELAKERLPDYAGEGRLYRHLQSGAELLVLSNSDPNRYFAAAFATPPAPGGTGAAHALEHLAYYDPSSTSRMSSKRLCDEALGFPYAGTRHDYTFYDYTSQHPGDFITGMPCVLYNALKPGFNEAAFREQVWRVEPDGGGHRVSGVLFNEMSQEMARRRYFVDAAIATSALPDTAFRNCQGGYPPQILGLDLQQLVDYKQKWYAPNRVRILVYGDVRAEQVLDALNPVLAAQPPAADAPPLEPCFAQRPFPHPELGACRIPALSELPLEQQDELLLIWLTSRGCDCTEHLAIEVLTQAVLINPEGGVMQAARKAVPNGPIYAYSFPIGLQQLTVFRFETVPVGGRGAAQGVIEALHDAADGEPPIAAIAKVLDQRAQSAHELLRGTDVGKDINFRLMPYWLTGQQPFAPLQHTAQIEQLRRRLEQNPSALRELLHARFVKNPHRVELICAADAAFADEVSDNIAKRCRETVQMVLAAKGAAGVAAEYSEMLEYIARSEDPERVRIANPPRRSDIPHKLPAPPVMEKIDAAGVPVFWHAINDAGGVHIELRFAAPCVPLDLSTHAVVLQGALPHLAQAARLNLSSDWVGRTKPNQPVGQAWLQLSLSCPPEGLPDQLAHLKELITSDCTDPAPFQCALMDKLRWFDQMSHRRLLEYRLSAPYLDYPLQREEREGLTLRRGLASLHALIEEHWPEAQVEFNRAKNLLLVRNALHCSVMAPPALKDRVLPPLTKLLVDIEPSAAPPSPERYRRPPAVCEGFELPDGARHAVGWRHALDPQGVPRHPAGWLLGNVLSQHLMHHVSRVGGAYEQAAIYDIDSNALMLLSARDPHCERTLHIFESAGDFLRGLNIGEERLSQLIAKCNSEVLRRPDQVAQARWQALTHQLGIPPSFQQELHEASLNVTLADFNELRLRMADAIDASAGNPHIAVFGPRASLERVKAAHAPKMVIQVF